MFVMLTHHRDLRESRDLRRMHGPCLLRSQKSSDDGLVATMYALCKRLAGSLSDGYLGLLSVQSGEKRRQSSLKSIRKRLDSLAGGSTSMIAL
jgi:hypothetical protein